MLAYFVNYSLLSFTVRIREVGWTFGIRAKVGQILTPVVVLKIN